MGRARRTLAGLTLVCLLGGGMVAGAGAAHADPAKEALALKQFKVEWKKQPEKTQRTVCRAYRQRPKKVVREAASAIAKDPKLAHGMRRPEWRRVVRAYLNWACSGKGTTPR